MVTRKIRDQLNQRVPKQSLIDTVDALRESLTKLKVEASKRADFARFRVVEEDKLLKEIDWRLLRLEGKQFTRDMEFDKDTSIYLNVQDFGAKGDGVTDETPFIQSALDFISTDPLHDRRVLFFPKGIYRVDSSIALPSGVRLLGEGSGGRDINEAQTVIRAGASMTALITASGAAIGNTLEALALACNNLATEGIRGTGSNSFEDFTLHDVLIDDPTSIGINAGDGSVSSRWRLVNVMMNRIPSSGIRAWLLDSLFDGVYIRCDSATGIGLDLRSVGGLIARGIIIEADVGVDAVFVQTSAIEFVYIATSSGSNKIALDLGASSSVRYEVHEDDNDPARLVKFTGTLAANVDGNYVTAIAKDDSIATPIEFNGNSQNNRVEILAPSAASRSTGTLGSGDVLVNLLEAASPADAQFLVLALDGDLTQERRFVPSTALSAVDGGANGDYTLSHAQVSTGDLHQDYLLAAGTRALTANWDAGSFKITSLELSTDTVSEETANAGVTVDGLLLRDASVVSASTELTIASGSVARTRLYHRIDTAGDAASDDLAQVTGGLNGMLLLLRPESDARTVVVKHNDTVEGTAGNRFFLNGNSDATLDDLDDTLLVVYDSAGDSGNGAWFEVSRGSAASVGGAPSDARYLTLGLNATLTNEVSVSEADESTLDTGIDIKFKWAEGATRELKIENLTASGFAVYRQESSAAGGVLRGFVNSEANPRVSLQHDRLELGAGGASALDVSLSRPGANRLQLALSDRFEVDTVVETTAAAGVEVEGVTHRDSYVELDEIAAPGAGGANTLRLYAADQRTLSVPFFVDSSGNLHWVTSSLRDITLSSDASDVTTATSGTGVVRTGLGAWDVQAGSGAARISDTGGQKTRTRGASFNVINWSRRIVLKARFAVPVAGATDGAARMLLGRESNDGTGNLDDRGIGIRMQGLTLNGQVHDGTTLTNTATLSTLTLNQTYDLTIISDGAGNVEWFLDDVSIGSSTGGPTGTGTATHTALRLEAVNTNNTDERIVLGRVELGDFA